MEQKKQSFMQALDEFIRPNRQGYLFSVLTSILGVACSIVPYICAGQIITELIQGQTSVQKILPWVLFALAGYFLKVCFSNLSTSLSHKATFSILEALRKAMVEKWQRVPMGYYGSSLWRAFLLAGFSFCVCLCYDYDSIIGNYKTVIGRCRLYG